jgi:cytochrome P450
MARATIELQDFLGDPFGLLEKARSTGWLADMPPLTGVVRHADVRELLGDPRLRANFPQFLEALGINSGTFYDWMAMSPLNKDGAEHQKWRTVMSRTFTPRRVEQIRPFLKEAAQGLVGAFAGRGSCEFVAEFADVYPSLGLCELIGVPIEDRDRFRDWANTIGLGFNPIELGTRIGEVDAALAQLLTYTAELAAKRRAEPRDDLISRVAQAGHEDGWNEEMVHGAIAGLVFAGHETTKNQLGWMVAVLGERPAIWDGVANGEFQAAEVVEEVLRYRSTVTGIGRLVAEPIERHGERLEPGTQVLLSTWSANQDEREYPNARDIDPKRNGEVPHLAFGHGAHHCLGAALARAELQEALAALTARLTCPLVGPDAVWKPTVGINGPVRLPIRFEARGL